jgi:hypothetical protein
MTKSALHPVAHDGGTNRTRDHETDDRSTCAIARGGMRDDGGGHPAAATANGELEIRGTAHSRMRSEHVKSARSGGKSAAALAAARGQDPPAGTRAHPQAKTVHPVASPIVRLIRAFAHGTAGLLFETSL